MTPEQRIERAEQARELTKNPLLVEALDSLETEAVDNWKHSKAGDEEGRELAWLRYKAVTALRSQLMSVVDDGKWAEADKKRASL